MAGLFATPNTGGIIGHYGPMVAVLELYTGCPVNTGCRQSVSDYLDVSMQIPGVYVKDQGCVCRLNMSLVVKGAQEKVCLKTGNPWRHT